MKNKTSDSSGIGKSKLLKQLYLKYRYLMMYVAFEILRDYGLAEDVVHEAFLKLSRNSFKIDQISCNKTKSFMVIITRHAAIDLYRRKRREKTSHIDDNTLELADNKPLPLDLIIDVEGIDEAKRTLAVMDSKYADIILLKYFHELSNKEISSLLDISEQNVRTRLHRAKKMLADRLSKGGADHEQRRIK